MKTVKELKEYLEYQIIPVENSVSKNVYNVTMEKIYRMFCKIESELIEKDKELNKYRLFVELTKNIEFSYEELKLKQLYKEDFTKEKILTGFDFRRGLIDFFTDGYVLKNNSDYDKLESKEEQE